MSDKPTKSKFISYTDKICRDTDGKLINGDRLYTKMILRFDNGKLHGENGEPAVETIDGHMEFWRHGRLHRKGGPAVTTICSENTGEYQEFWENGVRKDG